MIGLFSRSAKSDVVEKKSLYALLPFETDIHSHLIPGIDDGAKTLEESITLLRTLQAFGYRRVVTTPHVMVDSYRNSTESILKGLEILRHRAQQEGIALEIYAAAEYYMDEELNRRLQTGDLLTVEDYLLFETSYYVEPLNLTEVVYEIIAKGYRPLLAHPERYRYVQDFEGFYGSLRRLGVAFQVNINSLGGHYGRNAEQKAYWLMKQGWIDFLGSDLHHRHQATNLESVIEKGLIQEAYRSNTIRNDQLVFSLD